MNKLRIIIFCSLLISGCQNFFPAPVNEAFKKEQVYVYDEQKFATKALTQNYLKKKLVSLMSPEVSSQKLVKEIYYACYKHRDLMKDVVAETAFKINDKTFFEIIDGDALVIQNKSNSVFLECINDLNPNKQADFALEEDTVTAVSFRARWNTVAGAVTYKLYVNGSLYSTVNTTSDTVLGLSPGTDYQYYVVAVTGTGATTTSQTITATTSVQMPDTPSGLEATDITYDSVVVNWNPAAHATSYTLVFNGTTYNNISGTSMEITNLSSGKNYNFYVKANNSAGSSPNSSTAGVTTLGAPTNGLIAYYPFTGNFNEPINGKNGSASGVSVTTDRNNKTNSAYQFGGNDFIMVPYTAILAPTSQISFSTWVYVANWATYSASARIISKAQGGGWSSGFNYVAGQVGCYIYRNGTYSSPGFDRITLTPGWHNLTCTYDGRYTKTYADGVLKATDDAGGNYPITYSVNNAMAIGADAGAGISPDGYNLTGKIDDIRIYNRALSDAEVVSIYNSNN